MNRFEEALKCFDKAIQINPEDSDYYNNKANTLFKQSLQMIIDKMNRFEEALELYDWAIQKNPENSDYYNDKANTLLKYVKLSNQEEQIDLKKRWNTMIQLFNQTQKFQLIIITKLLHDFNKVMNQIYRENEQI